MKKRNVFIISLCMILLMTVIALAVLKTAGGNDRRNAPEISSGLELTGGISITYQVAGDEEPDATDMKDTIAKLQKRVDCYSREAIVYQEGTDRISIEIPGVQDANKILQELGRPGALYFINQTDDAGNLNYVRTAEGYVLNNSIEELIANGSISLSGTDVKSAQTGSRQDGMGNTEFAVDLYMTDEGTAKFAEVTRRAYNKGETLAIYYDGNFVSVANVNGIFTNGQATISPMDDYEEAENLASTIRIGGLKLRLEVLYFKVADAQPGTEAAGPVTTYRK